jgi:TIR domain
LLQRGLSDKLSNSCFISYLTKDQEFADRLYADLQNKGVQCWFAPHDLPILLPSRRRTSRQDVWFWGFDGNNEAERLSIAEPLLGLH